MRREKKWPPIPEGLLIVWNVKNEKVSKCITNERPVRSNKSILIRVIKSEGLCVARVTPGHFIVRWVTTHSYLDNISGAPSGILYQYMKWKPPTIANNMCWQWYKIRSAKQTINFFLSFY